MQSTVGKAHEKGASPFSKGARVGTMSTNDRLFLAEARDLPSISFPDPVLRSDISLMRPR